MSSASVQPGAVPPAPPPSVFLSYASEDRTAVRRLRDALAAAGLEVWYDENELGGGDAWDQKIRRQIRECDYFMPVISAATEARKEGYFRREWRLATERTLDMADDVMFLLPVVLDDTADAGARVPERFTTVQWLRCPGGEATPALAALAARLVRGEHTAPPRRATSHPVSRPPAAAAVVPPPLAQPSAGAGSVPPQPGAGPAADDPHVPPPMPAFPHLVDDKNFGQVMKFLAEIVWWAITAAWLLLKRMPKAVRVLVIISLFITSLSRCGGDNEPRTPRPPKIKPEPAAHATDPATQLRKSAAEFEKTAGNPDTAKLVAGLATVGAEVARALGAEIENDAAHRSLLLIPFSAGLTDSAAAFGNTVFAAAQTRLTAARPKGIAVAPAPAVPLADEAALALAREHRSPFVVLARLDGTGTGQVLTVRALAVRSGRPAWTGSFLVAGTPPETAAAAVAEGILALLPKAGAPGR
jgi:hypothetical protein